MSRKRLKVGIIGCGTIGGELARACQSCLKAGVALVAICDQDEARARTLNAGLNKKAAVLGLDKLIENCDLVVEAASARISGVVLDRCIKRRRDCMIMSVGGLIGCEKLLEKAGDKGIKVYIPSGALCGIDGLKSASSGRVDSVTLTTRKPPRGLEGAPYLKENRIDIGNIRGETVIFEGTAEEAIRGFPQNVNVSAALGLAGLGARRTRVRIVTSPDYTKNAHEVEIEGECGRIFTRTENVPSKANPKTSELAVFSAIATLKAITSSVRIGT
ncbi:MAG: aspartate dehydrogenase [Candidatus Omnitrophota bacterium]